MDVNSKLVRIPHKFDSGPVRMSEAHFRPAVIQRPTVAPSFSPAMHRELTRLELFVVSNDEQPIPGARVTAYYDYGSRDGTDEWSDDSGRVSLELEPARTIERLEVDT